MTARAACAICGGGELDVWWSDGRRRVFRCRGCDARFLEPRPPDQALAGLYSDAYYRGHYLAHAGLRIGYFRERLAAIERRTAERRVLDVGCGPGFFLRAAIDAGWRAAGIDISPAAIALAVEAGLPASLADVASFVPPFEPAVVTLWDVVAHVPDPRAFVTAAAARLPPGGLLVMKFPHRRRALYRIANLASRVRPVPGLLALTSQPHQFSPESAGRLLEAAGCRVDGFETVPEIRLPGRPDDSARLRAAKLATSAMVAGGLYRSVVIYGARIGSR